MTHTLKERIARRLKDLREKSGFTQADLAGQLGFNNRQTLSALERGERDIQPGELARAAEILGVPVAYFTDAFRLAGEGRFSFRAKEADPVDLSEFEERAGRWIATYRTLSEEAGVPRQHLSTKLELTRQSSYEDAQACAETLRNQWRLGDRPAVELEDALRRELDVLILHVDAPHGISGAASYLPGQRTILVNRHEPLGRRMFDMAHELFHLLTWDAMPPERIELREEPGRRSNRVEQLANNFAASLLMPAEIVRRMWEERETEDIHGLLNTHATRLLVSADALKWRLYNMDFLSKADLEALDDQRLVGNGRPEAGSEEPPPLFSRVFIKRVQSALDEGRLSLRRAVDLLDITASQLAKLCRVYELPLSYDL